jgi:hypothetical protein
MPDRKLLRLIYRRSRKRCNIKQSLSRNAQHPFLAHLQRRKYPGMNARSPEVARRAGGWGAVPLAGFLAGVAAILVVAPGGAAAPPKTREEPVHETVITGEVVETACFVMAGRHGQLHRPCATACARAGQPLGILEQRTGTLYVGVYDQGEGTPEDPLRDLIADRVEVRGTAIERGGVSAIVVKRVRSLSPPR